MEVVDNHPKGIINLYLHYGIIPNAIINISPTRGARECTMTNNNSKNEKLIQTAVRKNIRSRSMENNSLKNNESIVTVESTVRKVMPKITFKLYIDKTDFVYVFNKAYIAQVQDKVYLKVLKFSNNNGDTYYRLGLKGVIVGALYPTTDESSLSFNSIALDSYAITRILNTTFRYKDRLKSVFWLKEIRYVKNDEHKHAKLVTIPAEDGLSVGSAFMHNQ